MPQSSHSRTGFHPSRFIQMSHLLPNSVLLNKKSSGFHAADSGGFKLKFLVGDVVPLLGSPLLARRPPGLMSVKRCTSGTMALAYCGIVEPSVAAAIEISDSEASAPVDEMLDMELAVWNESMVMSESVGVGPCAPTASGRVVRSSEPLGLGLGRTVRIEEREDVSLALEAGCERMTVVL